MMGTAHADLGGDAASIGVDAMHLGGHMSPAAPTSGATVNITTDNGMTVREFLNPDGVVFAVSWSGPAMPDLSELLGPYFAQYAAALGSLPNPGRQRAIHLVLGGLVVDAGGHLRAYSGRAYLPTAVPAGVALESLR